MQKKVLSVLNSLAQGKINDLLGKLHKLQMDHGNAIKSIN